MLEAGATIDIELLEPAPPIADPLNLIDTAAQVIMFLKQNINIKRNMLSVGPIFHELK